MSESQPKNEQFPAREVIYKDGGIALFPLNVDANGSSTEEVKMAPQVYNSVMLHLMLKNGNRAHKSTHVQQIEAPEGYGTGIGSLKRASWQYAQIDGKRYIKFTFIKEQ